MRRVPNGAMEGRRIGMTPLRSGSSLSWELPSGGLLPLFLKPKLGLRRFYFIQTVKFSHEGDQKILQELQVVVVSHVLRQEQSSQKFFRCARYLAYAFFPSGYGLRVITKLCRKLSLGQIHCFP